MLTLSRQHFYSRTAAVASFVVVTVAASGLASAQTPSQRAQGRFAVDPAWGASAVETPAPGAAVEAAQHEASDETKVSVYPVLLWVPSFSTTTNVPPFPDFPNGPDLPGGSGSTSSSLDGAALAGVSIERTKWRIDADGIWATLGSTRDVPLLDVNLDIVYGHVSAGLKVGKGLYVTGGVRRVALKYDIAVENRPTHLVREPGLWDPLVGLSWHRPLGSRVTAHVIGEGGGFGAGADVDLSGGVRFDVELFPHVGLTLGYSALYLKLSDTVAERTLEVKQTLHGPIIGIGLYF